MKSPTPWLFVIALFGFQVLNYSITHFALVDLLGSLSLGLLSWATILAIAFCGIDFAGIARIFTPETPGEEPSEIWILSAAWFFAAVMNASLIWWGVSVALLGSIYAGNGLAVTLSVVMLIIRVLLVGTVAIKGETLFQKTQYHYKGNNPQTEYFSMYQAEIPLRKSCPYCGTYLSAEESLASKCPYCGGALNFEEN